MEFPDTHDLDWDAPYARHAPRVYNYFRLCMEIEADVSDSTFDTFEKAWRSRACYRRDRAGINSDEPQDRSVFTAGPTATVIRFSLRG